VLYRIILSGLLLVLYANSILAQDSTKVYDLKQITVFGKKYTLSQQVFPMEKSKMNSILELGGFNIITKGSFLAQDVYADGMKRGDFTVIIDGERYHNACPMRMDAPLSRINPIEIESVELVKSSANLQSGLGGAIVIHRSRPKETLLFSGSASHITGHTSETDISVLGEGFNNRASFRFATGLPYSAGNGKSFKDLYGYKENTSFRLGEGTFMGHAGSWDYSGNLMISENISFPYLQMDEIKSVVYNGSVGFESYKLYFNYTDHLMNNELRVNSMPMETDAKNLTVGLKSDLFEVYYRNWDADNKIVMANGMMTLNNHLLPDVGLFAGNIIYTINTAGFQITGKGGFATYQTGDDKNNAYYKSVYQDAEDNRIFPVAGLSVTRTELFADQLTLSSMLDFSADFPEAEALFVKVQRMAGKPWWSGNPTLTQPIRSSLKTNLQWSVLSADLFGSYILDYVSPSAKTVGTQKYQTYTNINALLAGVTVGANSEFADSRLVYTYGENRTTGKPLTEILPLQLISTLKSPVYFGTRFWLRHTWENVQKRVDSGLLETSGKAWNRLDAGLFADLSPVYLELDVENLLNHTYTRHLSYVRDPFSSGFKVLEPGTTIRLNLRMMY